MTINPHYKKKFIDSMYYISNRVGLCDAYSHLSNKVNPHIIFLMYHRVCPDPKKWEYDTIHPVTFEKQLQWLNKTYSFVSLDMVNDFLVNGTIPHCNMVAITFDDGYKDTFLYAFPILKKYRIPATILLTTGNIATRKLFWWDISRYILSATRLERVKIDMLGTFSLEKKTRAKTISVIENLLKKMPENKKLRIIKSLISELDVKIPGDLGDRLILTWDEIRKMSDEGMFFGAHTVNHPILTQVSIEEARYEIVQSKKDIETELEKQITAFSYPNGRSSDYNPEIVDIIRNAGFKCAMTSIPHMVFADSDPYRLGRIQIGEDFNYFKFRASGLLPEICRLSGRDEIN